MTPFSYRCTDCGRSYGRDAVRYLCPECGKGYHPGIPLVGVLEVVFHYAVIGRAFDRAKPDWNLFCPVEPAFPLAPVKAAKPLNLPKGTLMPQAALIW